MKNKHPIGLCIFVLVASIASVITISTATAILTSQETSSFSGVVGESPTKMLRQLQRNETEGEK